MTITNGEKRNLLVLDVDETLIYGTQRPLDRDADFRVQEFFIYRRPNLSRFLEACSEWYELGVWSSASDEYVELIVDNIFPKPELLHFVWGASRATVKRTLPEDYERFGTDLGEYHYQKRLDKLKRFGWPLDKILIVDDSPEKCATNFGNAIYPARFEGEDSDDELSYLASYLHELKSCENYRTIEKRRWRSSVTPMVWD
ncbi:MAG: HAD family hydrolase [Paracoccaceae bacterium]